MTIVAFIMMLIQSFVSASVLAVAVPMVTRQARSQDFFFFFWGGGGGGCVVWRGRGIFARGFLLPLNQYITNSGMIIVFYYRPTQSRLRAVA